ncbi:hypothetical protein [Magnetospira sp. QH-2]|uniref:hypothetical protein n=1 Tax=Magnetospira sp. (strain QH-2) TaxID=1288970 RepID=UPI0003E81BF4|nr:hypothetical protein [Magnetospira sp. QH-2]CCQ73521.1 Protein of unknown function [Magnetospira sp. QH-2]
MDDQVFFDGIEDVYFVGGMIRIDFFCYSPSERDSDGRPAPAFKQQLVLSPKAFAQSFAMQERMMRTLAERGVVTPLESNEKSGK